MNSVALKSNKDLSSDDFERLLQRLAAERNHAASMYEDLRRSLIDFFYCSSCIHAEDLADETINRLARRLEEGIRDIGAFARGIAKNIRHEARNKDRRIVAISELPGAGAALACNSDSEQEIQDLLYKNRQIACLKRCMQRLSRHDRNLFLAYHFPEHDASHERQQLAMSYGLTIGALRIKTIRVREKLQKCVRRCMTCCLPGDKEQMRSDLYNHRPDNAWHVHKKI